MAVQFLTLRHLACLQAKRLILFFHYPEWFCLLQREASLGDDQSEPSKSPPGRSFNGSGLFFSAVLFQLLPSAGGVKGKHGT